MRACAQGGSGGLCSPGGGLGGPSAPQGSKGKLRDAKGKHAETKVCLVVLALVKRVGLCTYGPKDGSVKSMQVLVGLSQKVIRLPLISELNG